MTILDPNGHVISSVSMINESGVEDDAIWDSINEDGSSNALLSSLARWTKNASRGGGIFERDRFVTPSKFFEQMMVAQDAATTDNVVAGVLESTESLALSRMSIEAWDPDEDDVWNQIMEDIELDARMREIWRELFTVSQAYVAVWWGKKTYKVRGRDPKTGNRRKKVFPNLQVPLSMSLLDPMKIIPVGDMMFGQEKLCYITTREEGQFISEMLDDNRSDDQILSSLIIDHYEPSQNERRLLGDLGRASSDQLWVLNPKNVFRVTATRPAYQRFADIRLKSVFELLDLKHQLREMDRAFLIGGTSFIVLVKKGSDLQAATPNEIANLQAQVRTLARVPVIVGDHRLAIEIVTPKMDNTLDQARHGFLDSAIAARLFQTFITNHSAVRDDTLKLARVLSRGLESRRHMMKVAIEKFVLKICYEKNEDFTDMPHLMFHPHMIALEFDANMANYYLDLRDRGDISRDTILNMVDIDQMEEFRKRKLEKEQGMDDVFQTQVPFTVQKPQKGPGDASSPQAQPTAGPTNTRSAGRNQGGNSNGGGAAPGTGQGQSKTS